MVRNMTKRQREYLEDLQRTYHIKIMWETIKSSKDADEKIQKIHEAIKNKIVKRRDGYDKQF